MPKDKLAARKALRTLSDVEVMTRLLWAECAREPVLGKLAVGFVIENRVKVGGWWGNTFFEVMTQPYQFSGFNDDQPNWSHIKVPDIVDVKIRETKNWKECEWVAEGVCMNKVIIDPSQGATHYWNPHIVTPSWIDTMRLTTQIGNHQFAIEKWRSPLS